MFGILTFNQRVSQSDISEHSRVTQLQLRRSQSGFTLIEIMVVVIIIGILAAIVAPNVIGRVDDAQITKAQAEISNIGSALKFYRLDFAHPHVATTLIGEYPGWGSEKAYGIARSILQFTAHSLFLHYSNPVESVQIIYIT